ncbi:MAG: NACHT domain-containing protein [Cyanobacteria bacterium J06650_10]
MDIEHMGSSAHCFFTKKSDHTEGTLKIGAVTETRQVASVDVSPKEPITVVAQASQPSLTEGKNALSDKPTAKLNRSEQEKKKTTKSVNALLAKWGPLGIVVTFSAYQLFISGEGITVTALLLITCSILWGLITGQIMEEVCNEEESKTSVFARRTLSKGNRVVQAIKKDASEEWQRLTFKRKYYQLLIHTYWHFETRGLEGDRALELKQMFVPLQVSQKSLKTISSALIPEISKQLSTPKDFGKLLELMSKEDHCLKKLAIIGHPGSGKTTLMRYLTLIYASQKQCELLHSEAPSYIPVLMYLRDVREDIVESPEISLADLINRCVKRLKEEELEPPQGWFAKKLKQNKCLILLDGLDEIANEAERRGVSRWVDSQIKEYPMTPIILTSRLPGYERAQLKQPVTIFDVQPFNLGEIGKFVRSWYLAMEGRSYINNELQSKSQAERQAERQAGDLISRLQNNSPLANMAVNPLLLTMIATVHRQGSSLPANRVDLYKNICQVLLEKRQLAKGLPEELNASQKLSVLQELAFGLMSRKTRSFSSSDVEGFLRQRLKVFIGGERSPDEFLRQISEVSGLLVAREEGIYEFAHLSFQEYLSSVQIRASNKEQLLIDAINDLEELSWWSNTIKLYTAQGESSKVIRAAIQRSTIKTSALALACVEESKDKYIDASVRAEAEAILKEGLESSCEERFESAVKILLTRRLENLLRLDEEVEIDREYITCAEYQLFVNEQKDKQVKPAHWSTDRFEPGTAMHPILGISAQNANAFCEWLTQAKLTPFNYRLPRTSETNAYSIEKKDIGCWCKDKTAYTIANIESEQWHQLQEQLQKQVKLNILAHIPADSFFPDSDCDISYARTLIQNSDLNLAIDLTFALSHIRTLALTFESVIDDALNRQHGYEIGRIIEHEKNLNYALKSLPHLDRYHVIRKDYYQTFDLYKALYKSLSKAISDELNTLKQEIAQLSEQERKRELERAQERRLELIRESKLISQLAGKSYTQPFLLKKDLQLAQEGRKKREQQHVLEQKQNQDKKHVLEKEQEEKRNRALTLEGDLDLMIDYAFSDIRSSTLGRAIDLELKSVRDRARALSRFLNRTEHLNLNKPLCHTIVNDYDQVQNICDFREYLLNVHSCLDFFIDLDHQGSDKTTFFRTVTRVKGRSKSRMDRYIALRTKVVHLYCHFSIVDLRKKGKMPVWEGIRIVRDKTARDIDSTKNGA